MKKKKPRLATLAEIRAQISRDFTADEERLAKIDNEAKELRLRIAAYRAWLRPGFRLEMSTCVSVLDQVDDELSAYDGSRR